MGGSSVAGDSAHTSSRQDDSRSGRQWEEILCCHRNADADLWVLLVVCLNQQIGEGGGSGLCHQVSRECPVLIHQGSSEIAVVSSVLGLLLPLTHGGLHCLNDHFGGSVDGGHIKVGGHWSEPLWVSGEECWRAGFYEPLALNAVIIPQDTGSVVLDAGYAAYCPEALTRVCIATNTAGQVP